MTSRKVIKEKAHAFKLEGQKHQGVMYILLGFLGLLFVYEIVTASLSTTSFAAFILVILLALLVEAGFHGHGKKLAVLMIPLLLAGTMMLGTVPQTQSSAYTFANGDITSTNGAITVPIPYIYAFNVNFVNTNLINTIPEITVPNFNSNMVGWITDVFVNILISFGNAAIYAINVLLGFMIAVFQAIISLPVYLFDAISVTTLGPVVDFMSFIPVGYAWFATAVVWLVALVEWGLLLLVIIKIMREAVGGISNLLGQAEEGAIEDTADMA